MTEIHPDYFKIPAADEKIIKELSDNIYNEETDEEELTDNSNNSSSEPSDYSNIETDEENIHENSQEIKPKNKILNPKNNTLIFLESIKFKML